MPKAGTSMKRRMAMKSKTPMKRRRFSTTDSNCRASLIVKGLEGVIDGCNICFASGKCRYLTARICNGNGSHRMVEQRAAVPVTEQLSIFPKIWHVEDDVLHVQLN